MLGHRIWGKRLGIIGMGRIGQAVARRARAFGLQIHYHNRRRVAPQIEEELEATYWESLDQMLARMDIISVNCPHTPATYHLLSARRLKLMRPEAYIVNTARGEVIDENALTRMIEAGEIAGAGLDVFEHEPAVNPKLVKLARAGKVVLLPHMGSATIEGRIDMGEKVIINIRTFMDGHRPPDRVLPSMLVTPAAVCRSSRIQTKSAYHDRLTYAFAECGETIDARADRGRVSALCSSATGALVAAPAGRLAPKEIQATCSSPASPSPPRRRRTSSSRWCSRRTARSRASRSARPAPRAKAPGSCRKTASAPPGRARCRTATACSRAATTNGR